MTKLNQKFYPLTVDEWLDSMELTNSQKDVLYFIRALDPYGNGIELNISEMAKQMSRKKKIHRSTVSRALKDLERKGYISMKLSSVTVKLLGKGIHSTPCETAQGVRTGTGRAESHETAQNQACVQAQQRAYRHSSVRTGTAACVQARSTTQKPAPGKDPSSSKTLQTNKDYIDLDREPENFADLWLDDEETNTKVDEFKQEQTSQLVEAEIIEEKNEIISTSDKEPTTAIVANPNLSKGEIYSACSTFENKFKSRARNPKQTNMDRLKEDLNWVPPGEWCTSEGKLDPNFLSWSVAWWIGKWGGNQHSAKADVKAYYRNDLARLPDKWEEYSETYLAKYKNADLRLSRGLKVGEKEEKELKSHVRAVTNPLPAELSCEDKSLKRGLPQESLSSNTSSPSLPSKTSQDDPGKNTRQDITLVEHQKKPIAQQSREGDRDVPASIISKDDLHNLLDQNQKNQNVSQASDSNLELPGAKDHSNNTELPKDSFGAVNNPQAYRYYQPQKETDKPITSEQLEALKKKISKFTKGFGNGLAEKRDKRLEKELSTLEKINRDFQDPILREYAIDQAKRNGYDLVLDENGKPIAAEMPF